MFHKRGVRLSSLPRAAKKSRGKNQPPHQILVWGPDGCSSRYPTGKERGVRPFDTFKAACYRIGMPETQLPTGFRSVNFRLVAWFLLISGILVLILQIIGRLTQAYQLPTDSWMVGLGLVLLGLYVQWTTKRRHEQ